MPEPTILAALTEHIRYLRDGNAVVVVGAGLDAPPWRDALARLTAELAAHRVAVVAIGPGAEPPADGPAQVIAWLEALRDALRAAEPAPPDPRSEAGELDAALGVAGSLARQAQAAQAVAELAGARGQWRTVAELKRAEIDALAHVPDSAGRCAKLYEQIGDLWHDRLGDVGSAIAAYLHGLALTPASRGLLHKLLEAFTQQRQWRRAIEMLERLAAEEASPDRRARFHYAAALIARDELDDRSLAIDKLTAALDDAPLTAGAFAALDDLLAERGDWKPLARAYRRQLARLGDAAPEVLRALWARLGDICLDHLVDREAATAAYQVACELSPGDLVRRERLAELYLAAGDARRRDAIAELQGLLAHAPDRVELYKALTSLYLAEHELDKAWCVAQVLVLLGAAGDDERRLCARLGGAAPPRSPRRLTEELWHTAIAHPGEDRRVGAILAAVGGALAADTAQPAAAFGLAPGARVDLERDRSAISRLVVHAAGVLAIDPAPMLWLDDAGDRVRVANTLELAADRPRPVPSLLVSPVAAARLADPSERVLAFEVGKRLAYLRPDRFAALAVATLPKLETAFAAVLLAGGALRGEPSDEIRALAAALSARLAGPVLEQIAALAAGLVDPIAGGRVAGWRAATDLTGNRAGLIVAGDLEAAAHAIATEGATLSGLAVKDRLRDLLGYAASEAYFAVRRHLGLDVRDGEAPARPAGDAPIA